MHASGSAAGLATALELAGFEATVVELSWYGDDAPAVPLGGAFHSRRLTLKSSQVGAVADGAARALEPRAAHGARHAAARDTRSSTRSSRGESPFDELPAVLARLAASPGYTLTHRIVY